MSKNITGLIVILLFSFLGMKALSHPGLFTAHDIWHQVARLYHYYQAVLGGQFPPYWISTLANGFGYPLFFFSYHLPWILALPLLVSGITIPDALKILFFASYFFSGIFMYFLANDIFSSKPAALIAAILYLWAPYRFSTILVSAAMGTAFVFVFLPILLWGIYKVGTNRTVSGVVLVTIGLAGAILSHLITTVSLLPLILLFTLWVLWTQVEITNRLSFLKTLTLSFLLGIGLSAFYLLPAIVYSPLTQIGEGAWTNLYQKNFVNLNQLIYSPWGYGVSDNAKDGVISYQIGIAQWISIVLLLLIMKMKRLNRSNKVLGSCLVLTFIFSVFMMIGLSRPLWDLATKVVNLDYPTMFLLPATFSGSLLAGLIVNTLNKKLFFFAVLVSISLYTNRNHLRVNMYTDIPVSLYVASEITTNSYHEYLPKTADIKLFNEPIERVLPKTVTLENYAQNSKGISFKLTSHTPEQIVLGHFSFPGMTLHLNEEKSDHSLDERGRITFLITAGSHLVELKFEETNLIKIAKTISIISILILFIWLKKLRS